MGGLLAVLFNVVWIWFAITLLPMVPEVSLIMLAPYIIGIVISIGAWLGLGDSDKDSSGGSGYDGR